MIALWFLHLIALVRWNGCLGVTHDRVLAQDLVKRVPVFARLPPDLPLTFAPLPGTQRILSPKELADLLRDHRVDPSGPLPEICIEWETARLTEPELIAAIQAAVYSVPNVHVEIVDYSRQPLPRGTLRFKVGAVSPPRRSDLPVFWPGSLTYDARHSVSVWVRAIVWVEHKVVVASEDLVAGKPIRRESIRFEQMREFPLGSPTAHSIDEVAGFNPRGSIRKGSPILLAQLEQPWIIVKGDRISVTVQAGSTSVSLDAVALSSGHFGEAVSLQNPLSGRTFRAIAEAKGTAFLQPKPI